MDPRKLQYLIANGLPLSLRDTRRSVSSKLFDGNFYIPTRATVTQIWNIVDDYKIDRIIEIGAGRGLLASCIQNSIDIDYKPTDSFGYDIKKTYTDVHRATYRQALRATNHNTLVICVFMHDAKIEIPEILRLQRNKQFRLFLVYYDDDLKRVPRSAIQLKTTGVVYGDYYKKDGISTRRIGDFARTILIN